MPISPPNGESSTTIPALSILSLSFLHLMDKKEDMAAKQRRKNFETRPLGEENRIDFHHEGFTLFIDGGGEAKSSSIQILNLEKPVCVPRFLINRSVRYQSSLPHDLSHHGARIQRDASYKFQKILIYWHVSCPPPVRSPSAFRRFTFMTHILSCS